MQFCIVINSKFIIEISINIFSIKYQNKTDIGEYSNCKISTRLEKLKEKLYFYNDFEKINL